jgi:hypothetical protein
VVAIVLALAIAGGILALGLKPFAGTDTTSTGATGGTATGGTATGAGPTGSGATDCGATAGAAYGAGPGAR